MVYPFIIVHKTVISKMIMLTKELDCEREVAQRNMYV